MWALVNRSVLFQYSTDEWKVSKKFKKNLPLCYLVKEKLTQSSSSGFSYEMQEDGENTIRIRSVEDYLCLETLGMPLRSSLISFLLRSQDLNGLVFSLSIDSVDLMFVCSSEKLTDVSCVFSPPQFSCSMGSWPYAGLRLMRVRRGSPSCRVETRFRFPKLNIFSLSVKACWCPFLLMALAQEEQGARLVWEAEAAGRVHSWCKEFNWQSWKRWAGWGIREEGIKKVDHKLEFGQET